MRTSSILKADLLDIIFENRNKDYGAYPLRKYYHERMYKALGLTFLLVSILSLFSFLEKKNNIRSDEDIITTILCNLPINPIKEKKSKPLVEQPKTPVQKKIATQNFSKIQIVDNTDQTVKPVKYLNNTGISMIDIDGAGDANQPVKTIVGKEPFIGNTGVGNKISDSSIPIMNAEIMPSFPGGEDALIRFLQKNLNNPQDLALDETILVKIMFIVGYDGILKGFQTVEDGGTAFNNEVIRVLKKMPAWIPGKTAGENVSVYYTIPVKFISQE